ncbi:LysR family transcriptional regulator [Methylobacterium oryzihabitans]|uniref:LysR family transcriptional regulator n=1 Tax=Methylobacterium oryzihabitans TaxID=2499852 RepID=A0A3S2VSQ7_9HYPH|nr:LysR family transcriptional regulator [Methylobacterium oryzihabitans]RVU20062.1 LysR family transcriptional regulator [Methylobacterium oryzihabitans]
MSRPAPRAIASITEADLRLMRIFRVVAEAGGLTAAESRLRMERSTISRHLKALEERLGGCLCRRGPAGFELTEFGQVALRASVTACDALDQVRDALNSASRVVTGDLMIGLADNCLTNPDARIVPALARFREAAPAVRLHVTVHPAQELRSDVLARRLHLCITTAPVDRDRLDLHPLFVESFALYVGGGGPVPRLSDLARDGYVFITRDNDGRSGAFADRLGIARQAVATGLEAVATLLAGGGFVGFLPTHYAAALAGTYGFRPVREAEGAGYESQFCLVRERARPLSPAGDLFLTLAAAAHRPPVRPAVEAVPA